VETTKERKRIIKQGPVHKIPVFDNECPVLPAMHGLILISVALYQIRLPKKALQNLLKYRAITNMATFPTIQLKPVLM
jgi:hypothetical protein